MDTPPAQSPPGPERVVPWMVGHVLVRGLARVVIGLRLIRWAAPLLPAGGIVMPLALYGIIQSDTGLAVAAVTPSLLTASVGTALWITGLQILRGAVRHPMTRRYLRLAQLLFLVPYAGLLAFLDPDPQRAVICTGLTLALLYPSGFYGTLLALRHLARLQGLIRPVEDARAAARTLSLFHVATAIAILLGAAAGTWHPVEFLFFASVLLLFLIAIPLGRLGQLARDIRWAIEMGYGKETSWQQRKTKRAKRY